MSIDHVGLGASNPASSVHFYELLLGALGMRRCAAVGGWIGFGEPGHASFWIGPSSGPVQGTHVAFRVASRREVDEIHTVAVRNGFRVKSVPMLRPEYHDDFYSAMLLDPDGHNIEVVCHART